MLSARHWLIHRPRLLQVAFWLWVAPFVLSAAGVELTHSANCPDNIYFRWALGSGFHHLEQPSTVHAVLEVECAACALTSAVHGILGALAPALLLLSLLFTFAGLRASLRSRTVTHTASRGPPSLLWA